jgi:hypothetical protein
VFLFTTSFYVTPRCFDAGPSARLRLGRGSVFTACCCRLRPTSSVERLIFKVSDDGGGGGGAPVRRCYRALGDIREKRLLSKVGAVQVE